MCWSRNQRSDRAWWINHTPYCKAGVGHAAWRLGLGGWGPKGLRAVLRTAWGQGEAIEGKELERRGEEMTGEWGTQERQLWERNGKERCGQKDNRRKGKETKGQYGTTKTIKKCVHFVPILACLRLQFSVRWLSRVAFTPSSISCSIDEPNFCSPKYILSNWDSPPTTSSTICSVCDLRCSWV